MPENKLSSLYFCEDVNLLIDQLPDTTYKKLAYKSPKNIYDTSVEDNPLSGFTVGLAKGVGMTIVRTGAGVYETVTFPFPIPEGYTPVIEPEFVFDKGAAKK